MIATQEQNGDGRRGHRRGQPAEGLAYEIGRYTLRSGPRPALRMTDVATYLIVHRLQHDWRFPTRLTARSTALYLRVAPDAWTGHSRPGGIDQDRPVTPEVAGSSPAAPVKVLQISICI